MTPISDHLPSLIEDSPASTGESSASLAQRTLITERNAVLEARVQSNEDLIVQLLHQLEILNSEKNNYKLAFENVYNENCCIRYELERAKETNKTLHDLKQKLSKDLDDLSKRMWQ